MPFDAMTLASDSPNLDTPDTPLYAVVKNGKFTLLDVQDMPCLTLTADGLDELANPDRLPMDALPQIDLRLAPPVGDDYGGF